MAGTWDIFNNLQPVRDEKAAKIQQWKDVEAWKAAEAANAAKNNVPVKNPVQRSAPVGNPIPAAPVAPAPPAVSQKELLDIYRAMNGGALPPGITPEMAQLIDMGLNSPEIQANPALQGILQQLAQQRVSSGADYAAAREQVGQNYQNLTGDVEQQGTAWMSDLLQRMGISPEAAALDPNIGSYGSTISNMSETADQNQATDQAWFDKMALSNDQMLQNQMLGLANGTIALPGAELSGGGGGGGGRGGRGYGRRGYGGGGGSGGGDWKDPATTDQQKEAAGSDYVFNNPDFLETVLAQFDDPQQMEYAQRILDAYKGIPGNVAAGISDVKLPAIEALNEAAMAQGSQRTAYYNQLPAQAASSQVRAQALQQLIESKAGGVDNVPQKNPNNPMGGGGVRSLMDQRQRADYNTDVGSMILQGLGQGLTSRGKAVGGPDQQTGNFVHQIESNTGMSFEDYMNNAAQFLQQENDKTKYEEAQAASTTTNPFTFENWQGYVPSADKEAYRQRNWDEGVLENVLAVAREFHPNYGMQEIKRHMDSDSTYTTSQKSYETDPALFDNNVQADTASATGPGALPSMAQVQTNNPTSGAAGFGESRGVGGLTDAANRILQNRLKKLDQLAERPVETASPWEAFTNPFSRKPVRPTEKPAARPPVTKAKVNPTAGLKTKPVDQTLQQKIDAQKTKIALSKKKTKKEKKPASSWSAFKR